MNYNTEATLQGIGQLHFNGHIIHHTWFQHIKLPSGKPDLIAIMILADIVYWYRPNEIKNEYSGELLGFKKKFKADMLQRSSRAYTKLYGISQRQASDAIRRLYERGLIIREYRNIETHEFTLSNIQFLAPVVEAIAQIQIPTPLLSDESGNLNNDDDFFPLRPVNSSLNSSSSLQNNPISSKPMNVSAQLNTRPETTVCAYTKRNTENTTKPSAADVSASIQPPVKSITSNIVVVEKGFINQNRKSQQQLPNTAVDAVIGATLTESQKQTIKIKVNELFSQKFTQMPQKLMEEIQFTLLSTQHFTESQQDFQKKLNTICKMVREHKWTPPAELLVKQNKIEAQSIQHKKQKWRELQLEHQHWNKMLMTAKQREEISPQNLDNLNKLVQSAYRQLAEFQQKNNISNSLPNVFLQNVI